MSTPEQPQIPWRDQLADDPKALKDARKYFEHRELAKLPGDVVTLFDLVHSQSKELNQKNRAILLLNSELEHARRNLWANWIVTIGQFLALATALVKLFWLR